MSESLQSWTFRVPGSPKTKRGAGKGAHGQMHSDRGTNNYEQSVAGLAIEAGLAAGKGPCRVEIGVVLPNRNRKDADRVTSAIFDGLKRAGRAALHDDNLCIVQEQYTYLIAVDSRCPSAIVTVTMLAKDRSVPVPQGASALATSPLSQTDFPESRG